MIPDVVKEAYKEFSIYKQNEKLSCPNFILCRDCTRFLPSLCNIPFGVPNAKKDVLSYIIKLYPSILLLEEEDK